MSRVRTGTRTKQKKRPELQQQNWLDDFLLDGRVKSANFVRVYSPIALATSLTEAVFIEHMLYMWLTKTKFDDGKRSYRFRDSKKGIYILPRRFHKETGISPRVFRSLANKYEDLGIIRTKVYQEEGNRKHYKLRLAKLKSYLRKQLNDAAPGLIERFAEVEEIEEVVIDYNESV
jgi:hypothetical protein